MLSVKPSASSSFSKIFESGSCSGVWSGCDGKQLWRSSLSMIAICVTSSISLFAAHNTHISTYLPPNKLRFGSKTFLDPQKSHSKRPDDAGNPIQFWLLLQDVAWYWTSASNMLVHHQSGQQLHLYMLLSPVEHNHLLIQLTHQYCCL